MATLGSSMFDALYRGEGTSVRGEHLPVAPWHLGEPQPIVLEIAAGGLPDPVLEVGCGSGDNALSLAERGHRVVAVDVSPAAIAHGRAEAERRGLDVEFLVADATTLDGVPGGNRTVVDCALLHCLDPTGRRDYLEALHGRCARDARLHVLCCDDQVPAGLPFAGLDEAGLRAALAPHWIVENLWRRRYTTGMSRPEWRRAVTPVVGEYPPDLDDPGAVDERGRVLLPIWQVRAVRR